LKAGHGQFALMFWHMVQTTLLKVCVFKKMGPIAPHVAYNAHVRYHYDIYDKDTIIMAPYKLDRTMMILYVKTLLIQKVRRTLTM